ncbi:MAG: 1-acyl-sn-glycerol-3-phosphate acyltransferase [Actinomycetota bacterium]|nr:1-acyl-sn-glycerol-3-phosphate acyltransferase [Actinomycetota bacterium]
MKWLSYMWFKLRGWSFAGEFPDDAKLIAVGAPHTTNWDFVLFLAALHNWKFKAKFIGKHTLFRWPFGYFFRFFGGIPVDRDKPGGIVGQVREAFDASDRMILVMAPEGTRKPAPYWKSGFVKIAEGTGVPVVFAGVDGKNKVLTIGPKIRYTGDTGAFMDVPREFYDDKNGIKPEGKGPVRLKEEDR